MLVITPEYFYVREFKNVLVPDGGSQDVRRIPKSSVRQCESAEPNQEVLQDCLVNEA